MLRSTVDIISTLPKSPLESLTAPEYFAANDTTARGALIGCAVESMKRHTTDEGWQIFAGLEHAGYVLQGYGLPYGDTDIESILDYWTCTESPCTLVLQDKREWDVRPGDFRDPDARFHNVKHLQSRNDIFKVTILKDAHSRPWYHAESAVEMGCHAWVVYYHPDVVKHLSGFVRPQHLIRTWHTVDKDCVPEYGAKERKGCILSGALSAAYPLRKRLWQWSGTLPDVDCKPHPGYHMKGCATSEYLKLLSRYKVAICTSSIYGYALRKIIEATCCGCIVVSDLPTDEYLPIVEHNLVRIPTGITLREIGEVLSGLYKEYDPDWQREVANKAREFYDYRQVGIRLACDIEAMRLNYGKTR